ncbi:hypothetical protein [Spiroplasma apis]|uniref:Transmembrane protein n=1 Tax=Spiroplasma apis B31 TaxID=1276258 RepID=V5RIS4_SPIAP|nr:hypothetical protein [Spiroplasma apis]AHB36464.1 hypothetical protein SAPIS_v1c06190 [Spiroplasma apis B31]
MFIDYVFQTIFFVCSWCTYNYYKKDYKEKILNKNPIIFYLFWGIIQLIVIISYFIFLTIYLLNNLKNLDYLYIPFTTSAGICLLLLYIKQVWFYWSIRRLILEVVLKDEHKSKKVASGISSFIPIIGYFTTLIFYFWSQKQLLNNDFKLKSIWY